MSLQHVVADSHGKHLSLMKLGRIGVVATRPNTHFLLQNIFIINQIWQGEGSTTNARSHRKAGLLSFLHKIKDALLFASQDILVFLPKC